MSKEAIKERADAKKAATGLAGLHKKFNENKDVSAQECRQLAEANGGTPVDALIEQGWAKIMTAVRLSVMSGQNSVQVPAGPTTHPEVRAAVVKRLEKAGFKAELVGTTGYIYW